jgi:hypothetical protein
MSALSFPSLGTVATGLYQVSCAAAVILCLWELSNNRHSGALAGVFSAAAHLFGAAPPALLFAAALMVPTLTAVRQAPSEEKDLFAGCLAAVVFAVNVSVLLT